MDYKINNNMTDKQINKLLENVLSKHFFSDQPNTERHGSNAEEMREIIKEAMMDFHKAMIKKTKHETSQ